jgi:hypothetical protein
MFDSAAYSRDVIDALTPSPFNWRDGRPYLTEAEQAKKDQYRRWNSRRDKLAAARREKAHAEKINQATGKLDGRIVHETPEQAKEAQRLRNRQFMSLKRAATKVNAQSDVCAPFMPKSVTAGR